jgi:hypothetical protein
MPMPTKEEQAARDAAQKPDAILQRIEDKLATIDGISTSDAFALGAMVRDYGRACSGEASSLLLLPLMDAMMKPKGEKKPWEE